MSRHPRPASAFQGVSSEAAGVSFLLRPTPRHGLIGPLELDRDEMVAYLQTPMGFAARCHGVTREQLQAWCDTGEDSQVYCSALTAKGEPCRNPVNGSHPDNDPRKWQDLQGGYCPVHGG